MSVFPTINSDTIITYKINKNLIENEVDMKKIVLDYYEYHKNNLVPWYLYLQKQYKGYHDILYRETEDNKPNQKLVNNYAKYITDVSMGYFLGIPVTYESQNINYIDKILEINKMNYEDDENSEIGKQCSIKGRCYELLYMNEDSEINFNLIKPEHGFIIYDNSIKPKSLLGVRYYVETDILDKTEDKVIIEVFTDAYIYTYEYRDGVLIDYSDVVDHQFKEVPMIEYINNEELLGDFEIVMSLINAYNDAQSDTSNDFKYFTDAYLMLIGLGGTESTDIEDMKKNRVMLLEENGQAQWLIKEINDLAVENYKNRLDKDISKFSMVPNLTDENFAGNSASGISLEYKLWGLEQLTATKEKKFHKSLNKRYELINNIMNIFQTETDDLKITFYRNIPRNTAELVKMLGDLGNIVSNKTKLEQIPFVDNIDDEMAQIKKEMKEEIDNLSNNSDDDNDNNGVGVVDAK